MSLVKTGYTLPNLSVTYVSSVRSSLERTISKLRNSLDWIRASGGQESALPARRQRRAWRVWYNKAPHAIGWSKRHYIFHDWRYSFTFKDVCKPQTIVSSALGSMTPDTSCVVQFSWFNPGSEEYKDLMESGKSDSACVYAEIIRGQETIQRWNSLRSRINASDSSTSKHLYLNFRRQVGSFNT